MDTNMAARKTLYTCLFWQTAAPTEQPLGLKVKQYTGRVTSTTLLSDPLKTARAYEWSRTGAIYIDYLAHITQ